VAKKEKKKNDTANAKLETDGSALSFVRFS
jgi:hypothetical protein